MSTSLKFRLAVAITVGLVLPLMSAPAFASKNNHGYSNGLASIVKHFDGYCAMLHDDMAAAESAAEIHAGTPAAEPFSKAADADYKNASDAGCSWAA
jgi:hypothetical protein